jgi:hypothetical protein
VENYENDTGRYIRDEFCRYICDDFVGVREISKMNSEWSDLVQGVLSITPLIKTSENVIMTAFTWHQESQNICLIMSQELNVFVSLKRPDSQQADPVLRLKVEVEKLVMDPKLTRTLDIPKVVSG